MTVSVHGALTLSNIVLSLLVCYLSTETLADLESCLYSSMTLMFVTSVQLLTGAEYHLLIHEVQLQDIKVCVVCCQYKYDYWEPPPPLCFKFTRCIHIDMLHFDTIF